MPREEVARRLYPPEELPTKSWPYAGAVEVAVPPLPIGTMPERSEALSETPESEPPDMAAPVIVPPEIATPESWSMSWPSANVCVVTRVAAGGPE